MVQVNLRGWDTHQNAFRDLKGYLLPSIDRCLSGFLDDLQSRGLLDETLIVMCGEMGRTPRISPISATGKNTAGEPFTPGPASLGRRVSLLLRRRRNPAGPRHRPDRSPRRAARQRGLHALATWPPRSFTAWASIADLEFFDLEQRPYRLYQGQPIAALL